VRRALLALCVLALPALAIAHTNPARRSLAVQVKRDAALVLVTWTVPSGEYGDAYVSQATFARSRSARRSLEATLAAKAIGPLTITLDGAPVAPPAEVKLTEDPPRSGRFAAAVLLTIPAGAKTPHALTVKLAADADLTRAAVVGPGAQTDWPEGGDFLRADHPLTVRW